MPRARFFEPYRSFLLYLELLRLDSKSNIHDRYFKKVKNNYLRDIFPDHRNSTLKVSLSKLDCLRLIKYEEDISDFDVKLEINSLEDALVKFSDNVDYCKEFCKPSNLKEDLEVTLDDLYLKPYPVIDIVRAFFDNNYITEFYPEDGKIVIERKKEEESVEEEVVPDEGAAHELLVRWKKFVESAKV